MSGPAEDVAARISSVRQRVGDLARQAGRDPASVRIVAVTKSFPAEAVAVAVRAGIHDVGESYVQEARAKREHAGVAATWHLVGGLQRNKARVAAALFDRVHSVDSVALAAALARGAEAAGKRLPVLVQANLSGRATQRGAAPDVVREVASAALAQPALLVDGLMTIAPEGASDAVVRRHFHDLRALRDDVARALGVELPHLSMGMSDDFPLAIEEGATFIRLGRALFGERDGAERREGQ